MSIDPSAELFRLLVEGVRDSAIFALDTEGHIVTWNAGAAAMKGYDAAEVIGRHFSMFYPQEAIERGSPGQQLEMARLRGLFQEEAWRLRKDGSRFWAGVSINAISGDDGRLIGFSNIIHDLSEARREREALQDSERRSRMLIEGVRDYAIFALDTQGRITSWNAGAERIKGYKAAEIIGQHFSRFYPPEAIENKWPEKELQLAAALGRIEDESWRVRKDGSRFWANVVITALRDERGALVGYSKITRDLTERHRREESIRLTEERFRLLVEGVKDYAIFMIDPEGRVLSWNAGAERIKGYRAAEIIGRHFSVFYTAAARAEGWPERELALARSQGRFEDEGWRVRKDGSTFWANAVITALYDREGTLRGFAKVTRDLTDRKRVEALEDSERRTQEFLAMLAHELRNPLAPIASSLEILLRNPVYDAEGELAKRVIQRQLAQLTRIVDDLLDVSRVTKSKISLRRRAIDLVATVHNAAEAARHLMRSYGHKFEVKLPEGAVRVEGDEQRLSQVLSNLLHNAAKYTPRGGTIEIGLGLEKAQDKDQAVITVKDTGVGISPDLLETIFDLFVQGQQTLARSKGGLGLGLTLVKRLVNLHGGTVEARSAGAGKGSEFIVRLPALAGAASAAPEQPAAASEPDNDTPRRVLIVDDNTDAADMLAILLRDSGHQVRSVRDGPSALSMVEDFAPHFVLLDIGLPGMNGYELAERMRRMPNAGKAVFIAVTGYGQSSDRAASERAGFKHHFVKPVDPGQIERVIGGQPVQAQV